MHEKSRNTDFFLVVNLRIQSEYRKIRPGKTPYFDTFHTGYQKGKTNTDSSSIAKYNNDIFKILIKLYQFYKIAGTVKNILRPHPLYFWYYCFSVPFGILSRLRKNTWLNSFSKIFTAFAAVAVKMQWKKHFFHVVNKNTGNLPWNLIKNPNAYLASICPIGNVGFTKKFQLYLRE